MYDDKRSCLCGVCVCVCVCTVARVLCKWQLSAGLLHGRSPPFLLGRVCATNPEQLHPPRVILFILFYFFDVFSECLHP